MCADCARLREELVFVQRAFLDVLAERDAARDLLQQAAPWARMGLSRIKFPTFSEVDLFKRIDTALREATR